LDASGGSVFLNLLGAAEGALIRAAASTQPLCGFDFPEISFAAWKCGRSSSSWKTMVGLWREQEEVIVNSNTQRSVEPWRCLESLELMCRPERWTVFWNRLAWN